MPACPFAVLLIIITYSGSANGLPTRAGPHKWGPVRGGGRGGLTHPRSSLALYFMNEEKLLIWSYSRNGDRWLHFLYSR